MATKTKVWAAYDPSLPVDRPDVSPTERLTERALHEWWSRTMRAMAGLAVTSWVDKNDFRLAIGGLDDALDWLSGKLGVAVFEVWFVDRQTYEIGLSDQASGQTVSLTLSRNDLLRQPVVRAEIERLTGLAELPPHRCWEWNDICVAVQRCAMFFDLVAAGDQAPMHGRVRD